jgi:uncharacterized protein YjiS (DUF1127 family)
MSLISPLLTWLERSQLRKQLLSRDDRVLADIGLSRELLAQGVRAWPWTAPTDPIGGLGRFKFAPAFSETELATAVAELEGYQDAELWDLGLTRGTIEDAVRHGRPGFPEGRRAA